MNNSKAQAGRHDAVAHEGFDGAPAVMDDLPTLDGDDRDVVGGCAPEREPDGVADPRRARRRGHGEARRPRWQQPSDLLMRDDQQPRVYGAHEPAALPLLLARPGRAAARAPRA